jgi:hypothetical protein
LIQTILISKNVSYCDSSPFPSLCVSIYTTIILTIELATLLDLYTNLAAFAFHNFILEALRFYDETIRSSEICLQYLIEPYFEVILTLIIGPCSKPLAQRFIF